MSSEVANTAWGLGLLELTSVRRLVEPQGPSESLSARTRDTLYPVVAFLAGLQPLSTQQSILNVGLGSARNLLLGRPIHTVGGLQTIGTASLLVDAIRGKGITPLAAVIAAYTVAKYPYVSKQAGKRDSSAFTVDGKSIEPDSTRPPTDSLQSIDQGTMSEQEDKYVVVNIVLTAAALSVGQAVAAGLFTTNELFISGVSLVSFGQVLNSAFPKGLPGYLAGSSPSYAIVACGLSILQYTAVKLGHRMLLRYRPGAFVLSMLGEVGSHTMGLYILDSVIDMTPLPRMIERRIPGTWGKVVTGLVSSAILILASQIGSRGFLVDIHIRISS